MTNTHRTMRIGRFSAGLNLPLGVVSKLDSYGKEIVQGLPPYAPAAVYAVADCENAPADWRRDDANTCVYVVGVPNGRGMWLDLTSNAGLENVVAAVVDVQGINVLTARPVGDPIHLEQYRRHCPVHGTALTAERHCSDCGFKWPAQNYLFSDDRHTMWIDGFRVRGANGAPTGETRQFLFTDDTRRGVAANVLGEKRSFDIKIAFFEGPRRPRPAYQSRGMTLESMSFGEKSLGATRGARRSMEVAAGALINQNYGVDARHVDEYGPLAGMIVLYYVREADLPSIVGRKADALQSQGIPVGNPGNQGGHLIY